MKRMVSWKLMIYDEDGNEFIVSSLLGNSITKTIDDWVTDLVMMEEEE